MNIAYVISKCRIHTL